VLEFELINWSDPSPIHLAIMLPPSIYSISNKNKSPNMFSNGFISVRFLTCLNDGTSIILGEILCNNSWNYFLMYFWNAVLDYLPISIIEKTGMLARYMVITAPEQMDLVPISYWQMLSFVLLIVTNLSQHRSAIISVVRLMICLCDLPGKLTNSYSLF
jgi:hypothetical protein